MQKEKNIQLKSHSQESVSAIPTLALFRSSSRRVSMRDIAKQLYPGLRHSGMTSHFNSPLIRTSSTFSLHGEGAPSTWRERAECVSTGVRGKSGFTLIELLVVVLIIGILAAIAVPQYQKTVEKSKAIEAITLLKSLQQAQQAYYMAHGTYATKFADLDVQFPWTGNTKFLPSTATDTKSNKNYSAQIEIYQKMPNIFIVRISGKYAGLALCLLQPTLIPNCIRFPV